MAARLTVRVQPGASKNRIFTQVGDEWKIAVTSPPVDGRANMALMEYLAGVFGVAKSAVTVARGASSRRKTIDVDGIDQQEAEMILQGAAR